MGLELPLALLGLIGVLIPLLAHRMRNRQLPRVVLPTFALLARAAAKSRHKRALTDLLLLLLRIGIVVLAALGLAAPYVNARLTFGDGQLANVALVIDDSLSMARRDRSVALVDIARARALEVLGALPQGSELSIVLSGKPARVLVPHSRDLANARRALERAELPAVREDDMTSAVELALRQQSRGLTAPRRLLILSDFPRHSTIDPRVLPADPAALSVERIGGIPARANVFISETHATADPTRPHETSIAIDLRVVGAPELQRPSSLRVEVEIDTRIAASLQVAVEHDAAHAVLHVPSPEPNAAIEARVRVVVDDENPADNQRSIVLGHEGSVRVLLVNGDPRPADRGDELYYVSRALSLLPDALLSLQVQSVDALSFEHADLTGYDVVVLANAPAPGNVAAARLSELVRAGGGLIVAAGSRIDAVRYNAQLGAILPGHIRGAGRVDGAHLKLGKVPQFLPEGLVGLREVRVQQRLLLEPGQADTLLSFEDGLPALLARSEGEGRTLLLATSLDADFGDLPLRPGFLPLLAAMIRDAAGPAAAARTHVAPGEAVILPSAQAGGYIEVTNPRGQTERFTRSANAEPPRYTATDSLGMFAIRAGKSDRGSPGAVRGTFVVDPPQAESDPTLGPLPVVAGKAAKRPTAVNVRKALTPPLLLGFFVLVALESLVRVRKRSV